ncbi:hypothetical protein KC726_04500 [Candidatus Woesebacteria bacterium]|nr:hypothetical protein [Candidatus Woesebacteria bacterium]
MKKTVFDKAKKEAIDIMSHVYDPLHDHYHVMAVRREALRLTKLLGVEKAVNSEALELACLWHDTSRRVIRQHAYISPFCDGIISARIAKKELKKLGVDAETIDLIAKIITRNETYLGLFPRKHFLESSIFSDADALQSFSTERFRNFLSYVEVGRFSKRVFAMYLLGFLFLLERNVVKFNHAETIEIMHEEYIPELKAYFEKNFDRIAKLTLWPIQKLVYHKIIKRFPESISVSYTPYFISR